MCHKNLVELLEKLEGNSKLAIHWFEDSNINLNTSKCTLFIFDYKYEHQWAQTSKGIIKLNF